MTLPHALIVKDEDSEENNVEDMFGQKWSGKSEQLERGASPG
jgi:hypothetical protein